MATKKEGENKKVRRPSAAKRILQSEKSRLRNKMFNSQAKTLVKSYELAAKQGSSEAPALLNAVYSIFDKGVKKGIVTQNKANRAKSKFATLLQK